MVFITRNEMFCAILFVLSAIGIHGKTTFSLNIPAIGPFRPFAENTMMSASDIKNYSGKRVKNDSIRMVYFHDQTVAIVELEPDKLLLSCELIEVYEPEDAMKALGDFHHVSRPVSITFTEMATLMTQCEQLDRSDSSKHHEELTKNLTSSSTQHPISGRGIFGNNPLSLFSGIIPGTKWCGTGDIARDYHDLGTEPNVDKCCRAHDLCPVKVRASSQRYNLTNDSFYTKSHCFCDDELYSCLRESRSRTAFIMGNIYFNAVQIPCIEDTEKGKRFRKAKNNF